MEPTELTIEILKSIRDEVKVLREHTNAGTGALRDEVKVLREDTNAGFGALRDELSQRIVHSEIRTATAIADLAGSVREMTGVLRSANELRPRLERCEQDIGEIRARLDRAGSG